MGSKSISKSVVWQLGGKITLQGLTFFTTPIFTRLLSTSDYGYVSLFTSWTSIVSIVVALEIAGSIGNARIKYEGINPYKYLSSILSITIIPFILLLCVACLFRKQLSELIDLREDLIILLVLTGYATFLINFLIAKLDTYKQVEKSALLSFFYSVIIIFVQLFFVIKYQNNRAIIKIYSQAFPTIFIGFIVVVLIYIKGKCFWNSEYNKFCLKLTIPLLGHALAGILFSQCDRLMLEKIQDESELGIYSVTFALCNILVIIFAAMNNAWVPFYYDFKRQEKTDEIIIHSKRYIKLFSLICVGFLLLATDVYKIMTPEGYWSGIKVIPIFVLSFYFNYLYLFPVNYEFFNCKTKLIPIGTLCSAVLNVILNALLIPRFSITGAVIASLISRIILFIIHEVFAKRLVKNEYEYGIKFFIPWILFVIAASVFFYISINLIILRWIIAFVIGIYLLVNIIKNKSVF